MRRLLDDPDVRFGQLVGAGALGFLTLVQVIYPAPASILFLGAVLGALNALIAMGIVLVYRANRVISFAQGELGAVAGLLAVLMVTSDRLAYLPALGVGLVAALLLGALVELLFVRRLSRAPRLILTVATIGIAQLLAAGELALPSAFGDRLASQDFTSPFSFSFTWSPVVFTGDHLVALVAVIVAGAGLGALLRWTRVGIAVRGAADSSERAAQLGIPVRHLGTMVWMVAAVLSALAFLLRAPIVGVPIGQVLGPALLLRALAAAVIGRMESLPITLAAGVALGMVEQAVFWSTGRTVIADAVLFAVVVGALLLQRRRQVARGDAESWELVREVRPVPRELARLPEVRLGRAMALGAVVVGLLVLPLLLDNGHVNLLGTGVILAIVGSSLVVLTGWAGEISLGHMAIFGFGAATAVRFASLGWALPLALVAAGVVGAVVAVVVGIPALRIRGPFLAVATFAFALASSSYFLNGEFFSWFVVADRVERPTVAGIDFERERAFYYLLLALLGVVLLSLRSFRRSRSGRVLVMVRDNPRAAQSYGVDVLRARLVAFALSGACAALAGGAFAYHQHVLGQSAYTPERSLRVFSVVVFGGLASLPGALAGAAWFTAVDFFVDLPQVRFLVTGLGLLLVLLVVPGGLGQVIYGLRDRALRAVARRRGVVVPSLVSDHAADVAVAPARAAVSPSAAPGLLEVRGLEVSYGHTDVLFGVDLSVADGEIVALLGTNGAGKSTLLRAICGSATPRGGTVTFDGSDVTGLRAEQAAARGISLVPGGKAVFPSLTVAEHLDLASWLHGRDRATAAAAIDEALALFPAIRARLDQPAGTMSGGEQQMLGLVQALITRPRLLMIDELSLGLAPRVVDELLDAVRTISASGTTIVLVEQSVNIALTVADRAVFLEKGTVRFDGPAADLLDRPDVLRSVFLAGARPAARPRPTHAPGPGSPPSGDGEGTAALEAIDLHVAFGGIRAVDGIDLRVAPGEVVGLIGPNGAGKTTVLDLVSGYLDADGATIRLAGTEVAELGPDARARLGLGRSFQDARLFPSLTVVETIAGALERHVQVRNPAVALLGLPRLRRSEARVRARVDELIELLGLGAYADKFVSELSTGSRRVVDLACCLAHEPTVLLLDEPSSGIAQREAEALGPVLLDIRRHTGAALLVIEHDIPLITAVSDRLVALEVGRVIAEGTPDAVLQDPLVVASYLGEGAVAAQRSGDLPSSDLEGVL